MKTLLGYVTAGLLAFAPMTMPTVALAETPADTLIQGGAIDDLITLDPAQLFEFTAGEIAGDTYQPLIGYDVADVSEIYGVIAESWELSDDGKTLSFKIREGMKFASGNDISAEDVVFSLVRAVKLNGSPGFILTQFGFDADNVDAKIRQTGDYSFEFEMDNDYAPSLVLYCLTATVAMVVDKDLVMSHEADGDFGTNWLKTNYAGSGPFTIREWRANEIVVMERNPNYSGPASALERIILRHIPEPSTQRLLLEKGDIDIARKLGADEIKALASNPDIKIQSGNKGRITYLGLSQKNEYLSRPQVRQALKYLVDYDTIAATILDGTNKVHQNFLPAGFMGAAEDNPFSLNVARAKELLAEAGLPDGFSVTMDVRNSAETTSIAQAIQQTFALAGVMVELIPGDGAQTLSKYRAREHDIYIGGWGPDYMDPHTNADTFARNPDNSDDAASKPLAWRNSWDIPEMTAISDSAARERDTNKRIEIYLALQREHQQVSPFVIMFQQIEVMAMRKNIDGVIIGATSSDNSFASVTK